jgi:hypothetical protein
MQGGAEGGARLGPALASTVQGLAALKEAWGETSRKGENRLTRLINAKMEMLCAPPVLFSVLCARCWHCINTSFLALRYVDAPHWGCLRHNAEVCLLCCSLAGGTWSNGACACEEIIERVEGKLHEQCQHYIKLLRETCHELVRLGTTTCTSCRMGSTLTLLSLLCCESCVAPCRPRH